MSDPNLLINVVINWIKTHPIVWAIPAIILAIFIWYKGTQIWNGIGNLVFAAKMSWQEKNLQKELDSVPAQKQALEETLRQLAVVKKDYEDAKAEKDRLEAIFNDSSKSAAAKVAEFKKSLASGPDVTPTDGITDADLCARARAIGASPATIAAVCGQ